MRFNKVKCIGLMVWMILGAPPAVYAHHSNETASDNHARVGEVSYFEGKFENIGVGPFEVRFTAVKLEDGARMLSIKSRSADGTYRFGAQFFDGTDHEITIQALDPSKGSVLSEKKLIVEVEALPPPASVKITTMLFLLSVMAAGMLAGVGLNYLAKAKRQRKGGNPRAASI